jgi:periplasmic divalent cation tolerance protein
MSEPQILFVYIPCGSSEEAHTIGRTLVEERLAACVNIFKGPYSIFRWEGKMTEQNEILLLAKTRAVLFERLSSRVQSLHASKTSCIAAIPVQHVNAAYASWILDETHAE